MDVDAATRTMLENLPAKTGHTLDEWFVIVDASGLTRHGEILKMLKTDHGVSHGFANFIAARALARGSEPTAADLVDAQYAGRKAQLRPLYEQLIAQVTGFGPDVEVAPKKTGVSLRRSKQFALIEAPSAARLQVGINLRGVAATDRLREAGGMCTHRVDVSAPSDVDDDLREWLRTAYDQA